MSEFVRENPAKAEMTEVLCCCDPNNLVGVVPTQAGLDGIGNWSSSAPVILADSADEFRQTLQDRFGGRLTR